MGMFDISDEQLAKFREQLRAQAQSKVSEPVLVAGAFRRGGVGARMVSSFAGLGAIVYAAISLFNKQKAGGLPDKVILAATADKLYAFKCKIKGREWQAGDEVAVWDRAGLQASTEKKLSMTMLTIVSPSEGETVTLSGVGVQDDPLSLEVMELLKSGATAPA